MCITWCHQRKILYWNHDDCHPVDCAKAGETHGRCQTCRYRLAVEDRVLCNLTRAMLPAQGGCCHWNVEMTEGPQKVIRDMLILLENSPVEPAAIILELVDVPYQVDENGDLFVEPTELDLPDTYGLGINGFGEEVMDWPDWLERLEA